MSRSAQKFLKIFDFFWYVIKKFPAYIKKSLCDLCLKNKRRNLRELCGRMKKPTLNITFSQKAKQDLIPYFIGNFCSGFSVSFKPEIRIV